ncbi:hypothetical protein CW304_27750 [Bacillus sp. UFRGS-B20]|nr:hypothetical protein CW304_27750 [Bacillus sp. UFRGS-B20]
MVPLLFIFCFRTNSLSFPHKHFLPSSQIQFQICFHHALSYSILTVQESFLLFFLKPTFLIRACEFCSTFLFHF